MDIPRVFVCATGDDENGDGTEAKPFGTIGRALRGREAGAYVELFIEDDLENPTPEFIAEKAAHLNLWMKCWRREAAHAGDLYVREPFSP